MSRRNEVAGYTARQAQHAGLWLDKYFGASTPENAESAVKKAQLVSDVAGIATPSDYSEFFDRWKAALTQVGVVEKNMREAEVVARLAVGLGGEAVLETAITLHRTYGVPYIPGSALKGLASSYADKRLEGETWRKKDGKAHHIVFGNTRTAGYVTFFDALYVPGSGAKNGGRSQALWTDVITVHHPDYYGGKNSAPADWDNPNPVPFLTATGKYLIALQGDEAWVEKAFEVLALALNEEGIGAKTSSGYGKMIIDGIAAPPSQSASAGATPTNAPTLPPGITRKGIIIEMRPDRHQGRVRDEETGRELFFSTDVIKGNFPARRQRVEFDLQDDKVVRLNRI